ncbi:MAG TPA: histidinol-phosphate transaminase [Syntrophorhabdaceae bacterium]|nr:histidinol-phosphate transaminase [Syntrophorhabdaceae bacterium]
MKLSIDESIQGVPYYPKAMMYGFEDGWTILSSNENPFPPSEKVMTAILDALPSISRYPGGEAELKAAIAEEYRVHPGQVVIGNGSNELIEMSLKAARHEKKNGVIISEPSFAFYHIAAQIYGYEVKRAPVSHMRVDLKALRNLIDERTRLIFLNNPLNPTGTIFEEEDFAAFIKSLPAEILVVVDEAYAEFAEHKNFPQSLKYTEDFPVVVFRTFSKAYGLAGLRVGYGLGKKSLIPFLERTKQPFSVNMIALVAARAALADREHLEKVIASVRQGKQFFYNAFRELSLEYVPTEANFILVKLGRDAETITKKLFDKQILVRFMGAYGLPDYIRVTIGRADENRRFIEALQRIV